jgi:hypothetical protein
LPLPEQRTSCAAIDSFTLFFSMRAFARTNTNYYRHFHDPQGSNGPAVLQVDRTLGQVFPPLGGECRNLSRQPAPRGTVGAATIQDHLHDLLPSTARRE